MGCKCGRHQAGPDGGELREACRSGSVEKLRHLLAGGLDVNGKDEYGEFPLILAAQTTSSPEILSTLLDARGDPSCADASGTPLPFLLLEKDPSNRLIKAYLEKIAVNEVAVNPASDKDTLLLAALKAFNRLLALDLIKRGARLDIADAHENTPLHVAAAMADEELVKALLDAGRKEDVRAKNSDGHTPVRCAQMGSSALDRRISPSSHWCIREVLRKAEQDPIENRLMEVGEEVWRCPRTGWCCSIYSYTSPYAPRNFEISAALALASGDAYSLTDAVEGAWMEGLSPPFKPASEVHPNIINAIQTLVHVLQKELRIGLESKDRMRLQGGLEMLRYARVAKMPEEEKAITLLVRLELEQAVASKNELELKQALMSAAQYGHTSTALFKQAQGQLEQILDDRRVECLLEQIREAMDQKDLSTLHLLLQKIRFGKFGSIVDNAEYKQAQDFLLQSVKQQLIQAVSSCNKRSVRLACYQVEKYGFTDLPEYQRLLTLRREMCITSLKEVALVRQMDPLRQALQQALEDVDLRPCNLQDDPDFKSVLQVYRELLELPSYFDDEQLVNKVTSKGATKRKQLDSEVLKNAFQMLFDRTHVRVRTKDRRGDVPKRLLVKAVDVVQNTDNLIAYLRRRDQIRKQLSLSRHQPKVVLGDLRSTDCCKTFRPLQDGRQLHAVWKETNNLLNDPIDPSINEFYLFHGTNPKAAMQITDADFRMDLAGSHAGTLYGRGIYFAESSSKSDEYAEEDERKWNPMLVCRVTLGRFIYTDEEYPDTGQLVRQCTKGESHSVLGDRQKCRNTFREMIIYDKDQAYPEFIVWYSREF